MNLSAALARLARAGITPEVLAAEQVDASDPAALRAAVDGLLADVADGRLLANHAQVAELTAAQHALWTRAERADDAGVAARLRVDLRAGGVLVRAEIEPLYLPCDADAHAA